jgi:hypothetical protein
LVQIRGGLDFGHTVAGGRDDFAEAGGHVESNDYTGIVPLPGLP